MGDQSAIEWTEATWNPLAGCSLKSDGCKNCYAMREAHRLGARTAKYAGLTKAVNGHPVWTGEVRLWPPHLAQPLAWTKPRRIFVNSMSDLFHDQVKDEWIDRIFAVMALSEQHTFQILTKRPERMLSYLSRRQGIGRADQWSAAVSVAWLLHDSGKWPSQHHRWGHVTALHEELLNPNSRAWPLPNVWTGVSVEDQATADERIPLLLRTPAAVRWVSYEPALGPVDFAAYTEIGRLSYLERHNIMDDRLTERVDWVVVGGESGPGARPLDLAWAHQTIAQGRAAGIPVFVKQLGARPIRLVGKAFDSFQTWVNKASSWLVRGDVCIDAAGRVLHNGADFMRARDEGAFPVSIYEPVLLRDRKGGDIAEWLEDLRIREYPKGVSP